MKKSIRTRVIELVAEEFGIAKHTLSEDTTYRNLNLDSMDILDLLVEIESEFNVEIADERAQGFKSLGDIIRYLEGVKGE